MIPVPPTTDYSITAVDYAALPAALLDIAKQHMRVDFTDDDDLIERYLASAIAHVELVSGWRIFPTIVSWFPTLISTAYAYRTPLGPVASFLVMLDEPAPPTDISNQFAIITDTPVTPSWLSKKDKTAFPTPITMTLNVGYTDADKLPPNMSDVILRIAASLYENRETVSQPSLTQVPFWMNDLIVGLWIPRA